MLYAAHPKGKEKEWPECVADDFLCIFGSIKLNTNKASKVHYGGTKGKGKRGGGHFNIYIASFLSLTWEEETVRNRADRMICLNSYPYVHMTLSLITYLQDCLLCLLACMFTLLLLQFTVTWLCCYLDNQFAFISSLVMGGVKSFSRLQWWMIWRVWHSRIVLQKYFDRYT